MLIKFKNTWHFIFINIRTFIWNLICAAYAILFIVIFSILFRQNIEFLIFKRHEDIVNFYKLNLVEINQSYIVYIK